MIKVGSIQRAELATTFHFLGARFSGRRRAMKDLTHASPDFVFWIFPDEYYSREGDMSLKEHTARFASYPGPKELLSSLPGLASG